MRHRLFVYGSLMRGLHNHDVLRGATFVEDAVTEPSFTMVAVSSFPGIVQCGSTAIRGEVYLLDDACLARCDALECVPSFYQRVVIPISGVDTFIYVLPPESISAYPAVDGGDWRKRWKSS